MGWGKDAPGPSKVLLRKGTAILSDLMNSTSTIDVEPTDALTQDVPDTLAPDERETDVDQTATSEARPEPGTRGTTTVSDAVVVKVVTMVAGGVDGVHRLDDEDSEVAVDGRVAMIRISLVVEYGQAVTALAARIRTDVIDAVEEGLGLDVASVDIHVGDIHTGDIHTGDIHTGDIHTEDAV